MTCGIGRVYTLILAAIVTLLLFIVLTGYRDSVTNGLPGLTPNFLVNRKLPMLNLDHIDQVETFFFFIGSPRSGHSIVGSFLDAHPDIIVGHEFNLFSKLHSDKHKQLMNRTILYNGLYQNSFRAAKTGWRSLEQRYDIKGYSLNMNSSNSWQGKFRKLRVIGDKSAGMTTRCIRDQPILFTKVFKELMETVRVPVKILHAVRNPYDMIATRLLYRRGSDGRKANYSKQNPLKDSRNVIQSLGQLKTEAKAVRDFTSRWTSATLEIHNADLINNPQGFMENICKFLGVECSESYLKMCRDHTYSDPTQPRHSLVWSESDQTSMESIIKENTFFHRYAFDSP